MPVQKVDGKEGVRAAIREAFQSDKEHAEAHRKYSQAKSALGDVQAALEDARKTLNTVEAEARETAVKHEIGEASKADVTDMVKAVDTARSELEEAENLVEIREEAASILKDRFDEAREAAQRRLSREWGETYREAVQEQINAYRAFEKANEAVKQIEYDIKVRTLRLPHPKASWPEPATQPGGITGDMWAVKLSDYDYQTNGE